MDTRMDKATFREREEDAGKGRKSDPNVEMERSSVEMESASAKRDIEACARLAFHGHFPSRPTCESKKRPSVHLSQRTNQVSTFMDGCSPARAHARCDFIFVVGQYATRILQTIITCRSDGK